MELRGTTILGVRKDGMCAIAGDGQVTLGENTIMKHSAKKVRRIYNDSVVIGFAGSVAECDSYSLFRFILAYNVFIERFYCLFWC